MSYEEELLNVITPYFLSESISSKDFNRMKSFLLNIDYFPNSEDSVIWKNTGNMLVEEYNYENALKCYENAVEIDHNNTDALYNIGLIYKFLGRIEESKKIFDYLKISEKTNQSTLIDPSKSFEPEFKIRGIRVYYLIEDIIPKDDQEKIRPILLQFGKITKYFEYTTAKFDENYIRPDTTLIKLYFVHSKFKIKTSQSKLFYETLFHDYIEYLSKFLKQKRFKFEVYDVRILFRLYPEERTNEFIPIPQMSEISKDILMQDFNEKPPDSHEGMIKYVENGIFSGEEKALDIALNLTNEYGSEIYGSFGVKNQYQYFAKLPFSNVGNSTIDS